MFLEEHTDKDTHHLHLIHEVAYIKAFPKYFYFLLGDVCLFHKLIFLQNNKIGIFLKEMS